MTETELREFKRLTPEARSVSNANDEYRAGLLADIEADIADGEGAELDEKQETDLDKTITDCETRLDEFRKIVQTILQTRNGEDELTAAIQEAESLILDRVII